MTEGGGLILLVVLIVALVPLVIGIELVRVVVDRRPVTRVVRVLAIRTFVVPAPMTSMMVAHAFSPPYNFKEF
jgi:hypothetical protein